MHKCIKFLEFTFVKVILRHKCLICVNNFTHIFDYNDSINYYYSNIKNKNTNQPFQQRKDCIHLQFDNQTCTVFTLLLSS